MKTNNKEVFKMKSNSNNKAFALKTKGAAALIIAALIAAALLFTGCNQPSGSSSGGNSGGGATPPTPPAPPEIVYEFVAIPEATIAGVDPDYTLPGTENYWKGVFRAGRKVKLSPYKLGKTEVTYNLWKQVYDWAVKPENGYVFANPGVKGKDGSGSDDEPVTTISWRDCIVWCNAYTQMKTEGKADTECVYRESDASGAAVLKDATKKVEGSSTEFICDKAYADMSKKGFRLPTEAEWEYAARWQGSDTENAAQYGEVWLTKLNSASGAKDKWDTDETGLVAWYWDNSGLQTHPVGKKRANALGLHDMSGNVLEWCFDWYNDNPASNDADYMKGGIVTDPQGAASGSRGG